MIGLLNGSPKAPGGASGAILERMGAELGSETILLSSKDGSEEAYVRLNGCEAVVIVFPIYADALPSHLLRFLMDWESYRKSHGGVKGRVYAVSHAGFYDGIQCRWSLDIIRNFCARVGLTWCGGVGLGGAAVLGESGIPEGALRPLREAISLVAQAAQSGTALPENRFVSIGMPRWLYKTMGNMGWKNGAKRNSLKPKELYRTE